MTDQKINALRRTVYVCRGIQALISITSLALSAVLLTQYKSLHKFCKAGIHHEDCNDIAIFVGVLEYCVAAGALFIVNSIIGITGVFWVAMPWYILTIADNCMMGFYMGGATTLTARMDTWKCPKNSAEAKYSCDTIWADAAIMYVGFVVNCTISCCRWKLRGTGCTLHGPTSAIEVDHEMQDRSVSDATSNLAVGKRRSYSQLSD